MAQQGVSHASAARTALEVGPTITNLYNGQNLVVVMDATVDAASAAVTVLIDGLDPASGKWYNILTSAALAAVATTVLRVSPHLTASANLIAKDIVPRTIRIRTTVADTDAMTYSIGYSLS